MSYPEFFDTIENISLQDPLAEFLGVFEGGIYEISYLDVVKAAGHSCPTLAGAYLMTRESLKALYPGETPRRGEISADFAQSCDSGVAGVIAQVVSNITGATAEWGFKGIAGRFNRTGLMSFETPLDGAAIRFGRSDTGKSVLVTYTPGRIVQPGQLLQSALKPDATAADRAEFGRKWQQMVEEIFTRFEELLEIS